MIDGFNITVPAIGLDAFPRICNVKFGTGLGGGSILLNKTRMSTAEKNIFSMKKLMFTNTSQIDERTK